MVERASLRGNIGGRGDDGSLCRRQSDALIINSGLALLNLRRGNIRLTWLCIAAGGIASLLYVVCLAKGM